MNETKKIEEKNEFLPEYDICKCGYNPALNEEKFDIIYSEFGCLDKILLKEGFSNCKIRMGKTK